MCPHTLLFPVTFGIYVSSYYGMCVLIPLYVCPHTTICVLILRYVSSYYNMCPHTTIYVFSYNYICVLLLLPGASTRTACSSGPLFSPVALVRAPGVCVCVCARAHDALIEP